MIYISKNQQGDSLLEIIVAVGVVTVVLVGMISAISVSMANSQYSRNKAQATKYAQEGIEWLRIQRDKAGFTELASKISTLPNGEGFYCFQELPDSLPSDFIAAPCGSPIANTIFYREATLYHINTENKIEVQVRVYWSQGTRTPEVVLDTILTNW